MKINMEFDSITDMLNSFNEYVVSLGYNNEDDCEDLSLRDLLKDADREIEKLRNQDSEEKTCIICGSNDFEINDYKNDVLTIQNQNYTLNYKDYKCMKCGIFNHHYTEIEKVE